MKHQHFYLIHIQYLGFRFSGWLKQPKHKTIHMMIDKTLDFIMGENTYKSMGCSRTDAKVSANHSAFELFTFESIDIDSFLVEFNHNLPTDIRATKIEVVNQEFNIIQAPKTKEYLYLFSFGVKIHPFACSLITSFPKDNLDLELMKKGAQLFEGTHNFKKFCTQPKPNTVFVREITVSEIIENTLYTANFFPETSYAFRIKGKGFMRYQIRLMMAQLVELGRGNINLEEFEALLSPTDDIPLKKIVQSSGLMLNSIEFE